MTSINTPTNTAITDRPGHAASPRSPGQPLPRWRLHALRAAYLFVVIGLAAVVWPQLLDPQQRWPLMDGVVACMLGAFSLLSLVGLRHPLAMLPVLFWELLWKTLWLARVALPEALNGRMDAATEANVWACLVVVVIVPAIPWGYAWRFALGRR